MFRFTIRSALLTVAIAAFGFLVAQAYLDYRADYYWPNPTVLTEHGRALTPRELAKITAVGSRQHTTDLLQEHPPRGHRYWQQEAQAIRPGMTEFALWRYVPQAASFQACTINGLAIPRSGNHWLLIYAVDARLAIACVMQTEMIELESGTNDGFSRVVRVVGLFEHDGVVDDFGTLRMTSYDIKDCIPLGANAKIGEDEPSDAPKDRVAF